MSKLCISLPPFAPDYSGAASALFELGGMIIIHDASGCTGNYTSFDEPRWFGSSSAVYCSGLRHMDAILGNDEKLIKEAADAAGSIKPKFIAVLGSPVPTVIGTDLKGVAKEIEAITGIPSIGLETKGLAYYGKGIRDATAEIMKIFATEKLKTRKGTVNILGMTPLDFHINGWEKKFKSLFEENGMEVIACYNMGLTLDDIRNSTAAELNIAVSQAGVQQAEYMKEKYGIPFVAVTPIGDGMTAVEKARKALDKNFTAYKSGAVTSDVLIAGDQIISNSIREYIFERGGVPADVAVLFDCSPEFMSVNDKLIKDELQLRKLLNSGKYRTVVGDPMLKTIIDEDNLKSINFVSLPHVAVSSKVHWDEYKDFLGSGAEKWLNSIK